MYFDYGSDFSSVCLFAWLFFLVCFASINLLIESGCWNCTRGEDKANQIETGHWCRLHLSNWSIPIRFVGHFRNGKRIIGFQHTKVVSLNNCDAKNVKPESVADHWTTGGRKTNFSSYFCPSFSRPEKNGRNGMSMQIIRQLSEHYLAKPRDMIETFVFDLSVALQLPGCSSLRFNLFPWQEGQAQKRRTRTRALSLIIHVHIPFRELGEFNVRVRSLLIWNGICHKAFHPFNSDKVLNCGLAFSPPLLLLLLGLMISTQICSPFMCAMCVCVVFLFKQKHLQRRPVQGSGALTSKEFIPFFLLHSLKEKGPPSARVYFRCTSLSSTSIFEIICPGAHFVRCAHSLCFHYIKPLQFFVIVARKASFTRTHFTFRRAPFGRAPSKTDPRK